MFNSRICIRGVLHIVVLRDAKARRTPQAQAVEGLLRAIAVMLVYWYVWIIKGGSLRGGGSPS